METNPKPIIILLADDDAEDREMTRKALDKNRLANDFYAVADGEQLLDFLHHRGKFAPPVPSPTPGLILLDLNMPRLDGREALAAIKADPLLRRIPVVVLTTSQAQQDIFRTYDLGCSSFISKPVTFESLVQVTMVLGQYWFQIVTRCEAESAS